jgi:hypothetical protein
MLMFSHIKLIRRRYYAYMFINGCAGYICCLFIQLFCGGGRERHELHVSAERRGVSFDKEKGTMTLINVSPLMTFFADRPDRAAGHVPTSHFVQMWTEGQDSFASDPPKANLSILGDKEGATNIVVEVMNPRFKDGNLTYDVKVLDGDPPAKGGLAALFIDYWIGPRGALPPQLVHRRHLVSLPGAILQTMESAVLEHN